MRTPSACASARPWDFGELSRAAFVTMLSFRSACAELACGELVESAEASAMAAMRHSRIELTMNCYTDPVLLDVAGATRPPGLPRARKYPDG